MDSTLLLGAKLSRPKTSRWHMPRAHLHALLRDGLSRKLTTLIAAAGHGKTCTLGHFLAETGTPYLWMQLDQSDSDLSTFTRYLAQGIVTQLGGGDSTVHVADLGRDLAQVLPHLTQDLAACQGHVVIVLDDFHLLTRESPVGQLVASLLQYTGDHVHICICSRTPLPFSTARLKVIQEATELTEEDLRFTPGEVRTFMREMAALELDEIPLERICHLTEGWSAALVLLAASIRRRGSSDSLTDGALPGDLFAYLADEVVHSLSPELQEFMEDTSLLEACSPQTCDGVLGRTDSAAMLTQILNSNILLTQLGADSFRYHHLLQRFLQERLQRRDAGESFRRLLRQAGDWHLSRELSEEAFRHYLHGGWLDEAARLVEKLAPLWLRTKRLERLRVLTSSLPKEVREHYPWITLCEARRMLNEGQHDTATALSRIALHTFEERGDGRGIVQSLALQAEVLYNRGQVREALEVVQRAADALQPDQLHEQAEILRLRAHGSCLIQEPTEEAEADLHKALALYFEAGDLPGESLTCDLLGLVREKHGDYISAIRFWERTAECSRAMGEPTYEGSTNLAWGYGHVGRTQEAIRLFEEILNSSTRKLRRAYAASNLVPLYTRLADFAKAVAMAQTAQAMADELGHKGLKTTLAIDLAGLYRLAGQPHTAVTYANESIQLTKQQDQPNGQIKPSLQTALLHLFHTGNAGAAARMVEKALDRITSPTAEPFYRMMLTFVQAVSEFRQTRTESRPGGVRILQEGLAQCSRRGYEFFVQHEWPLALTAAIYGFAYGVSPDVCANLVRSMSERLPEPILKEGIPLVEAEARLIPAAWQAIPDDATRDAFSALLTAADRRRVVNLAVGPAPLRIQCLGPLNVVVGSEPIDVKALKRRKAGQLLVLLLSREGPMPREQVMDRLWPDLDPDAADTSLRVCLHHLRRLLEPHLGGKSKSRYIPAEGGLIWFSRQPEVQSDLDEFRAALHKADEATSSGQPAAAATLYEVACRLYRGDLSADDPYSDAIGDLRNALRDRYFAALEWLGTYAWKDAQDPARAILAFKQQLTVDEAHEPAHQALMRIYLENGQVSAARQQYLTCREALSRQLGAAPSRATESLLQVVLTMESESTTAADGETKRSAHRR